MTIQIVTDSSPPKTGLRIVVAGGGTGGHLFPGIAIADEIKRRVPDAEITFVGTKDKIEARVVPERGYNFAPIWISGFRRKSTTPDGSTDRSGRGLSGRRLVEFTLSNLLVPVKMIVAIVQSLILIKKMKPNVVVGTGGYVCGPPLYVASLLGIPTLVQEQNSYPGATTRKLASRVNEVHITFESSKKYLRRLDNVRLSGNPTSAKLGTISREDGARHFNLVPSTKTLLVFGGSLGATSINNEIERILPDLLSLGVQLIWQTGRIDFERINSSLEQKLDEASKQRVRIVKFIEHMEFAYAASDLAACRAGASTLAELTVVGLPSVLVPYPFAAADHQTENARALVEQGASVMIKDSVLQEQLLSTIRELVADDERLKMMSARAKALGKPEAAAMIAGAVLALARA